MVLQSWQFCSFVFILFFSWRGDSCDIIFCCWVGTRRSICFTTSSSQRRPSETSELPWLYWGTGRGKIFCRRVFLISEDYKYFCPLIVLRKNLVCSATFPFSRGHSLLCHFPVVSKRGRNRNTALCSFFFCENTTCFPVLALGRKNKTQATSATSKRTPLVSPGKPTPEFIAGANTRSLEREPYW